VYVNHTLATWWRGRRGVTKMLAVTSYILDPL
jgi:hypothetical protein